MRNNVLLAAIAAAFAVMAPCLASAMPMAAVDALATRDSTISPVEKAGYWVGYYAPYAYYQPYASYGYVYRPYVYYGYVPSYSYYDYYQTYGCSVPDQYCVYYAW
jgi:hypothetical protein